jgi:hypothetical protein
MRSRLGTIHLAVFLISFPGYPLLVGAANVAGLSGSASSMASLAIRALNVGLAVLLILGGLGRRRDNSSNILLVMLTLFWLAYFVRIFFDTIYSPQDLWQSPSYYWIWAVGGCFIPMLALALWPQRIDETDTLFSWLYMATFAACLLAFFAASGSRIDNIGQLAETGRARIGDDRLNPISLGHLGATLVVQSIWALVFFRHWRSRAMRLFLLAGLGVGFYVLMMANSRGPIIAALACLAIIILFSPARYKVSVLLLSGVVVASIVPLAHYLEETYDITTFSRLFGMTLSQQADQSARLELYADALRGVLESPLVGSWLEIPGVGYPHNFILESYMATGVFFGSLLVISVLLLCRRAVSVLLNNMQAGWVSLLFFQHLIGAQFSGALYGSTYMWTSASLLMSLCISAYAKIDRSKIELNHSNNR